MLAGAFSVRVQVYPRLRLGIQQLGGGHVAALVNGTGLEVTDGAAAWYANQEVARLSWYRN